jgi:hypothetical protein
MADEASKQAEIINGPTHDRFAVLALMTPPLRRTVFLHCQTIANFHARSAKIARQAPR